MKEQINWRKVWNKRKANFDTFDLNQSFSLNGYDGPQSILSEATLSAAQLFYERKNRIRRDQSIFEVGCGSGAFLYYWANKGNLVGGIDYSSNLVTGAKKLIPNGKWTVDEAVNLNVEDQWDHVVSFSSFLYYPDHRYALEVFKLMLQKAKKSVAIYDLPDLEKKKEAEEERKKLIGASYDSKYQKLGHLYFERHWWVTVAKSLGYRAEVYDLEIEGYINSSYRFNVSVYIS